jgi:hypothetical protein
MIAAGAAPAQFQTPPYVPTPIGVINVIPQPVVQFPASPSWPEGVGVGLPAFASLNAYPRNAFDASNYFTDICPNCALVHHIYSLAPFTCHSGTAATASWPGTTFQPVLVVDDLPTGDYVCITKGANAYVAIGPDVISYSFDGMTWAQTQIPTGNWQCGAFGNSKFLAIGYDDFYNGIIASSTSGVAGWALVSLPSGIGQLVDAVWNASNLFVAVGPNTCITSPDGTTWTKRTIPAGNWTAVGYNGSSLYMAIDTSGKVATSPDGTTWTLKTAIGVPVNELAWGNSLFCVVGPSSACYTSVDGVAWVSRTIAAGSYSGIINDGTQFVAVGNGVCATSTDGTTWSAQTIGAGNWQDVVNNGTGFYAAIGYSAIAASSYNRTLWTSRTITGGWEKIKAGKIIES